MRLAFITLLLLTQGASSQRMYNSLHEFLVERGGFDGDDLRAVEAGTPVVKLRPGRVDSETRLLGVVKIHGSPETFAKRYRDIVDFEKGTGVLEIGWFSDPPKVSDLAGLTLDESDLEDLKKCRVGNCDIKLSGESIQAFQRIDWSKPGAVRKAEALARRMIVDFLKSYQEGGNAALGALHDKKNPLRVGQQFNEMLQDPDLPVYFPRLFAFLSDYPHDPIPGAEEFFYWSKVDFGLKPVVRLSQVVIYEPEEVDFVRYAMASKMLYSSHYFNTGLELKFLVLDRSAPKDYYLVVANRSRSDGLTGFTGAFLGGHIRGKARDGLESYLRAVKRNMEGKYARGYTKGFSSTSSIVRQTARHWPSSKRWKIHRSRPVAW
jgi:hypothetical protein